MFSVTIRWGKYVPKDERLVTTEEFQTQAEVDAYLLGIDDMDGWADYEVIEDDV